MYRHGNSSTKFWRFKRLMFSSSLLMFNWRTMCHKYLATAVFLGTTRMTLWNARDLMVDATVLARHSSITSRPVKHWTSFSSVSNEFWTSWMCVKLVVFGVLKCKFYPSFTQVWNDFYSSSCDILLEFYSSLFSVLLKFYSNITLILLIFKTLSSR